MNDSILVDAKIKDYLDKNILAEYTSKEEILGHIAKSEHNLDFLNEISSNFNDWMLVVCYYASYHIALALILTKGYFSKNHDATLCVLIRHFYTKGISKDEIELLNRFDTEDILFYVQSKQEREKASYSTRIKFNQKDVDNVKLKTILFINKVKSMIMDEM